MPRTSKCKEQEKRIGGVELAMVEVRSDVKYIKKELTEIKDKLNTFIECVPERFSDHKTVSDIKEDVILLKKKVNSLEIKWAYATGIAIVLVTIVQILLKIGGIL